MTPRTGLGLAVIAGLASGLVTLSVISGGGGFGMILAYITPLPLVLVGLACGLVYCLGASVIGALAVVVGGFSGALGAYLAIGAVPALLLTAAALTRRPTVDGETRWSDSGEMLVLFALAAVVVTVLVALSLPTDGKAIEDWLRDQAAPALAAGLPSASDDVRAAIVNVWVAVMPAIVGVAWLAMAMVNGLIGQWAVSHADHGLRPTPDYADLKLPVWLTLAAGLAGLGGLMDGDAGYLARNVTILLLAPMLVAGLAEIHLALRGRPHAGLLLALFYGVFFALFGWAAIPVTAWGLMRQWMKARRKPGA